MIVYRRRKVSITLNAASIPSMRRCRRWRSVWQRRCRKWQNRLSGWQHGSGGCWRVKPIPSTAQAGHRLEGAARGLTRRAAGPLAAWRNLLTDIASGEANPGFIDWMEATRRNGEDFDIGIHRHYLDPTEPFSRVVLGSSHGAVITSATLTDRSDAASELPVDEDWQLADALTGATTFTAACPAGCCGLTFRLCQPDTGACGHRSGA